MVDYEVLSSKLEVLRKDFNPRGHDVFSKYSPESYSVHRSVYKTANRDIVLYDVVKTFICENCGDSVYWHWVEGNDGSIKPSAKTACEVGEILSFEVSLTVTSGEIIFGHTLFSQEFPPPERDYGTMSLNNALGRENFSKFYASLGVISGRVNSRFPELWYRDKTAELIVGSGATDEEDEDNALPPKKGFRSLGSISGAVWGFEIADKESFLASGGVIQEDTLIASIKPGTYRFTIFNDLDTLDEVDYDEPVIYARGKREVTA